VPFRDDLIERTLEQLNATLQKILQTPSDIYKAETLLDEAYRKHIGTDGQLLKQLSSQELLSTMQTTGILDKEKSYLIAALLDAEAWVHETVGQDSSEARLKALDLYLEAALANVGADDIHERVERLAKSLEDFVLPEITEWRLFHYEVKREHFDKAETKLFEILETSNETEKVTAQGHAFYKHLLNLSDAVLEKGNLPRAEVEEGYTTFKARLPLDSDVA
jgi:Family of unknown function (DUF6483)